MVPELFEIQMMILYLTVYLELVHKQLKLSVSCLGRHCMLEKEKERCQQGDLFSLEEGLKGQVRS